MMGDSITYFWPVEQCVPNAFNVGISGEDTAQMLKRFQTAVIDKHPDVVHILGGTNDIPKSDYPGRGSLFEMAMLAKNAGIRVVLGTIPQRNWGMYGDGDRTQETIDWNNSIRDMAKTYGFGLADYYAVSTLPGDKIDDSLFRDGIHPNAAGYAAWCPVLKAAI